MGKSYETLNPQLVEFIEKQRMFFVATAPLSGDGSVNLSPKGYDSLRIVDNHTIEWVDLGGSGVETIAHLRENGRITLISLGGKMVCRRKTNRTSPNHQRVDCFSIQRR